jgi:hypothetical protein
MTLDDTVKSTCVRKAHSECMLQYTGELEPPKTVILGLDQLRKIGALMEPIRERLRTLESEGDSPTDVSRAERARPAFRPPPGEGQEG